MAKFLLKHPKGKEKTLIYLVYHFSGKRFKYSTSQMIHPDKWNFTRQRAKKEADGSAVLNFLLDKYDGLITDVHRRLVLEGQEITTGLLRSEISRALHKSGSRERFVEFIDRFITESSHKGTSKTIFRTTLKHLKNYPGAKDFADINAAWLKKYTEYLEGKGFAANYVGKNIAVIKQFLNEAYEQGVTRNVEYKSNKYKKPGEEAQTVYLSVDELLDIYRVDLSQSLDRVRCRFLIGAFTALRYSDFSKLEPDNIAGQMIRVKAEKTGQGVVIPLHWVVREILERFDYNLPAAISNQKTNDYIKLIARRAGIKEKVVKSRTIGGNRTDKTFEKWELVTTHTARRSAATNMYLAGIPAISIMKITGHKTEKSFMRYIRISQEQNAQLLQNHPFFAKPTT